MAAILKEVEVAGERFVRVGDNLLVASKSEPGTWHHLVGETCDCKGFQFRGHCRHISARLELEASTTTDTVTVERTDRFGGAWVVIWLGVMHGLPHYQQIDAERHADGLREATEEERRTWIGQQRYMERWEAPVMVSPASRPSLYVVQREAML